jgi:protein TonB
MRKKSKDKDFIKQPVYKGGMKAMQKFIEDNLRYPEEALKNRIEGSVGVNYSINHLGIVSEVKIISGIGHGCDEEAARLVSLLRFDVKKTRGLKVLFHRTLHIHFHLNEQPKLPVYQYTVTPATGNTEKPSGNSISYSIRFNE